MKKVRLSDFEIGKIQGIFEDLFLPRDQLWLFGSRVNVNAKGGDIDLYVETTMSDLQSIVRKKIQFSADIEVAIGEQKIDVVVNYSGSEELPIYRVAKQTGVKLT